MFTKEQQEVINFYKSQHCPIDITKGCTILVFANRNRLEEEGLGINYNDEVVCIIPNDDVYYDQSVDDILDAFMSKSYVDMFSGYSDNLYTFEGITADLEKIVSENNFFKLEYKK